MNDRFIKLVIEPFPARAGMNRSSGDGFFWTTTVPRTRGDEPKVINDLRDLGFPFPARAGMNRRAQSASPIR